MVTVKTEALDWHTDPGDFPDADLTVLIELDPAGQYSEPVFMGFYDGEVWLDIHGVAVDVIAWANIPKGTRG